ELDSALLVGPERGRRQAARKSAAAGGRDQLLRSGCLQKLGRRRTAAASRQEQVVAAAFQPGCRDHLRCRVEVAEVAKAVLRPTDTETQIACTRFIARIAALGCDHVKREAHQSEPLARYQLP